MVNFFRTTAFHRARFLESLRPSVRPCRRSSRPCRRDRPCARPLVQSQVALVEVAGRGVADAGRAHHQHRHRGRGRLDRGAARHHRFACRAVPWLSSARASPSRAWNGSTDGLRAPHRREAAVFALRARSTGRTQNLRQKSAARSTAFYAPFRAWGRRMWYAPVP